MTDSRAVPTLDENAYAKKFQCLSPLALTCTVLRDSNEVAKKRVGTHSAMLLFVVSPIFQGTFPSMKRRQIERKKERKKEKKKRE